MLPETIQKSVTCIHVSDLGIGHLLTLEHHSNLSCFQTLNLGRGAGTTVRELVNEFGFATNQTIATRVLSRRPGDVAKSCAHSRLVEELIMYKC